MNTTVSLFPAFALSRTLHVRGFEAEQTFTIELDADNLAPGTTILQPADAKHTLPPRIYLDLISRPCVGADLRLLRLETKRCCRVVCPPSSGTLTPNFDKDAVFAHFTELAKGTEFHILFDHNWVKRSKQQRLLDIINNARTQEVQYQPPAQPPAQPEHRQADWTVFGLVEPPRAALPEHIGRSQKRARSPNTSVPPSKTQHRKRVLSSKDAGPRSEIATAALSRSSPHPSLPNERSATIAASPSPTSPSLPTNKAVGVSSSSSRSSSTPPSSPISSFSTKKTATIAAPSGPTSASLPTTKVADVTSSSSRGSSLPPSCPDLHLPAKEAATIAASPGSISPRLFTNTTAIVALSPSVINMIKDMVDAAVTTRLQSIADELYQSVEERCEHAGMDLQESLDDHRIAMLSIEEEELEKFEHICNDRLADLETKISATCDTEEERQLLGEETKFMAIEESLITQEGQHLVRVRQYNEKKKQHLLKKRRVFEDSRTVS